MKTILLFFALAPFLGPASNVIKKSENNGCTISESYIHCTGTKGKFLPAAESKNVRIILITLCDMSMLTEEDFAAFPEVFNIEIRGSNFSLPAQNGLFRHLKDLRDLRIERCNVGNEVATVFAENHILERLFLRNNRISSVSRHLLGNLRNLEELDVSENDISTLEDGVFDGLVNLKMLNISRNALNGSSAGVVASSTTRCKVCRPEGTRSKCTREEVDHCVSGRPLDRLWWRAPALSVQLQGNPLCDEFSEPLEIQPSDYVYRGGVECEIHHGEGHCFQHKQRRLFLMEACSKESNSTSERKTVLEGGTNPVNRIVIFIETGIIIGGILTLFYLQKRNNYSRNELSDTNLMGAEDSGGESSSRQDTRICMHELSDTHQNTDENTNLMEGAEDSGGESSSRQGKRTSIRTDEHNDSPTVADDSPLHSAALKGDLKKLEELKQEGADLKQKNSRGESALWCAALAGHNNVVKYLIKHDHQLVHSVNKIGETPLHIAAWEGNEVGVNLLLDAGAEPGVKNEYDSTPLHLAMSKGIMSIVKVLLEKQENINDINVKGETPLSVAVRSGQVDAVKLLLDKKADVNIPNIAGRLPLHIAAWNGNETIVDLLISHGSPINQCNDHGNTPLHDACRKGHKNIVQCLLGNGSVLNARNKRDKTPLHKAVKGDHVETVKLLLQRGADVNARNADGKTPLEIAKESKSISCIEAIENYFSSNMVHLY